LAQAAAKAMRRLAALALAGAFYVPGLAPVDYDDGEAVEMRVTSLTSRRTQLPYDYYTVPFCKPAGGVTSQHLSLGEVLMGDHHILNSPYEMQMNRTVPCRLVCEPRELSVEDAKQIRQLIDDEYVVNLLVDSLPAAMPNGAADGFVTGFPVGLQEQGRYYFYNHLSFHFFYHKVEESSMTRRDGVEASEVYRVILFEVEPRSLQHGPKPVCDNAETQPMEVREGAMVRFTYEVEWHPTDIALGTRWDAYVRGAGLGKGEGLHWFSILNSLGIIVLLTFLVATIILRTLHRDIALYNDRSMDDQVTEESGWKLCHADVFRTPAFPRYLAVATGSGVQILGANVATLAAACCGFVSPSSRGTLVQLLLFAFVLLGGAAGFTTARLYKFFRGADWKRTTIMCAMAFPGFTFGVFFAVNMVLWHERSSGAVPFGTLLRLLLLWFGVSIPLVFYGAFRGYRMETIEVPTATGQQRKRGVQASPQQHWTSHPLFVYGVGGSLPFAAVFTELFFLMSSVWQHHAYYLFGFLALVLVILVVTCAETAIAFTYFQLTAEDPAWWWRAFGVAASGSAYMFAYALVYFYTRLHLTKFASVVLYFGYMYYCSVAFALMTGSIGLLSSFVFVRAIYGAVKID